MKIAGTIYIGLSRGENWSSRESSRSFLKTIIWCVSTVRSLPRLPFFSLSLRRRKQVLRLNQPCHSVRQLWKRATVRFRLKYPAGCRLQRLFRRLFRAAPKQWALYPPCPPCPSLNLLPRRHPSRPVQPKFLRVLLQRRPWWRSRDRGKYLRGRRIPELWMQISQRSRIILQVSLSDKECRH